MIRCAKGRWRRTAAGTLMLLSGCATANHTANDAAVGTGLGALAGGIIGHQSGHTAGGAIVGAAAGALAGGLIGNAEDAREERDAAVARAHFAEQARSGLTNSDLIRMAQSGLGEDVIITSVQTRGGHFDLSPDGMIQLKQSGVSDRVIQAVQQSGSIQPASAVVAGPPAGGVYVAPGPLYATPPYGYVVVGPRYRRWRRW